MQGPLFFFEDGSTLSRPRLVQSLHQVLSSLGVDDSSYSEHSFRIGAATTAAKIGVSDSPHQDLGTVEVFGIYAVYSPWLGPLSYITTLGTWPSSLTGQTQICSSSWV